MVNVDRYPYAVGRAVYTSAENALAALRAASELYPDHTAWHIADRRTDSLLSLAELEQRASYERIAQRRAASIARADAEARQVCGHYRRTDRPDYLCPLCDRAELERLARGERTETGR